jgi:hypothetical protein
MNQLTEREMGVLLEALDDEYHACATYDQVIADFGDVSPFTNIREAEARHIEALLSLFRRFGLQVPHNSWPGRVERYPSLLAACEAGVAAEVANAGLHERLLATTEHPEIAVVLRRLQEASQQRHLPAFRRCVGRKGEEGAVQQGCGEARGRRWRGGRS